MKDLLRIMDEAKKAGAEIIQSESSEQTLALVDKYLSYVSQIVQISQNTSDRESIKDKIDEMAELHSLVEEKMKAQSIELKSGISAQNSKINVRKKYYNWLKKPGKIDKTT